MFTFPMAYSHTQKKIKLKATQQKAIPKQNNNKNTCFFFQTGGSVPYLGKMDLHQHHNISSLKQYQENQIFKLIKIRKWTFPQ